MVELTGDLASADRTHLLRLLRCDALSGVIERLADVAWSAREGLRDLSRCLVADIPNTPLASVQQCMLAPLQPLARTRPLFLAREGVLETRKLLESTVGGRLGGPSAYEDDLLPISGRDQGIHAQVNTCNRLVW
jgi:hypothetical protein